MAKVEMALWALLGGLMWLGGFLCLAVACRIGWEIRKFGPWKGAYGLMFWLGLVGGLLIWGGVILFGGLV